MDCHRPLALSVVVPTHDASATLDAALRAIRASNLRRADYELIVVDDASDDESPAIAARHADTVVRLTGRPTGPAYARNRGVELARGSVVAFVDADVLVRPDTLRTMTEAILDSSGDDALSARYDASPIAPGFVSQYWNLLLHYSDQRADEREAGFFTACGAVRRSALVSAGMFDEWRFHDACLEGVEFGLRLRVLGHRVRRPGELLVTHLKRWTLRSVLANVWRRGSLLARSLEYDRTRQESPSEVLFALRGAILPAAVVVSALGVSAGLGQRPGAEAGAGAVAVLIALNLPVLRFFARLRGAAFAAGVAPLHLLVQLVAATALCRGWMLRAVIGDELPDAATQAYAELGVKKWPPVPRRI